MTGDWGRRGSAMARLRLDRVEELPQARCLALQPVPSPPRPASRKSVCDRAGRSTSQTGYPGA